MYDSILSKNASVHILAFKNHVYFARARENNVLKDTNWLMFLFATGLTRLQFFTRSKVISRKNSRIIKTAQRSLMH
jgi:hypothetical protein